MQRLSGFTHSWVPKAFPSSGKKFGAVGLQNSIRAVRRPILAAWTLKHQTRNRLQALPQRSIRLRSAPSSSYRQARLRPPSTAARLETTPAHRRLDSASPPPSSVVAASDLGSPQCAWSFSAAVASVILRHAPLPTQLPCPLVVLCSIA
jgi:hypothetical protein